MSRIINDDSEKLIASEPRVLKNPKRNYSQIEKEGLSVTFGVKQSHQYVSGQSFKILLIVNPTSDFSTNAKGYLLWVLLIYKDG